MVDRPDSIKPHTPMNAPSHPMKTDAPQESYNSQYHISESGAGFLKKMFPQATNDEVNKIFDLWMKTIAHSIEQNQKFHEEQRDERKRESGDEDEL